MMKYKEGDILYYVNPFIYTIELVKINMGVMEADGLHYIDEVGAYLKECDLYDNVFSAREHAHNKLTEFYYKTSYEIMNTIPKREDGG